MLAGLVACTVGGPAAPPATVPATPVVPTLRGQPLQGFPDLRATTDSSFAHDHGDMTTIDTMFVAGQPVPQQQVLAQWIELHGGWGAPNVRSDSEVQRVAMDYTTAVLKLTETTFLTEPDRGIETFITFHPPRVEFIEADGKRWVVVSGFSIGHISQYGQHFAYHAAAYNALDGSVPPRGLKGLPEPYSFSEARQPQPPPPLR